ncbi:MAG: GntR family transcriptional regulator [Anaerolineales bacterium]|nr:GntR family transcriptional regulator [Anaerolineales bacterium]
MFEPLDFHSPLPLYAQLVERIERLIIGGDLVAGDRLPTTRALASELRINFNTVARAYRILAKAGLVTTLRGRGSTIQMASHERQDEGEKDDPLRILTRSFVSMTRQLGYTPQEIVETVDIIVKGEGE